MTSSADSGRRKSRGASPTPPDGGLLVTKQCRWNHVAIFIHSWVIMWYFRFPAAILEIRCKLASMTNGITLFEPAVLSETRMRFRLMLSSMSAAAVTKWFFFNISETISDFKIYHKVALDSLCISTGNDVINYFRSVTNRTNVNFWLAIASIIDAVAGMRDVAFRSAKFAVSTDTRCKSLE